MYRLLAAIATVIVGCRPATADQGCNIADLMYGRVRIELIPHKEGFETGIIMGADFDSKRFSYYRILGQIASPERDGSRLISDVNGESCG